MSRRLVVIMCAALAVTAFAGFGRSAEGAAPATARPTAYAKARPVATELLQAIASGRSTAGLEAPASRADGESLDRLTQWISRIPIGRLRVSAYESYARSPGSVGVLVHLHATLGSQPSSTELDLGERLLEVRPTRGGWRVSADATSAGSVALDRTGLAAIPHAAYHVGAHAIVIDATGDPDGAQLALATADRYGPLLQGRYGGDRYMRRVVIFLLPDADSFARVGEATGFDDVLGEELHGLVFMNHSSWNTQSDEFRRASIVHELAHVASIDMMQGAPTSLVEGIARYEECKAVDAQGYACPLDDLADAYDDGYPEMQRWRSLSRWGLTDAADIDRAYMDGMAMTAVMVENHGGTEAVRRLAAEYRIVAPLGYPTAAQVRTAFRRATGVSFRQITVEAHALVWRESEA